MKCEFYLSSTEQCGQETSYNPYFAGGDRCCYICEKHAREIAEDRYRLAIKAITAHFGSSDPAL
jgi:hypothetical protein